MYYPIGADLVRLCKLLLLLASPLKHSYTGSQIVMFSALWHVQGRHSREYEQVLGWFGSPEVAHRDNIGLVAVQNSPHRPGGPSSCGDLTAPSDGGAQPGENGAAVPTAAPSAGGQTPSAADAGAVAAVAAAPSPAPWGSAPAAGGSGMAANPLERGISSTGVATMGAATQQQQEAAAEELVQPSRTAAVSQPMLSDSSRCPAETFVCRGYYCAQLSMTRTCGKQCHIQTKCRY